MHIDTNGRGGGIAFYVKKTLSVIGRADLEKDFVGERMWLELLLPKAKGILFGTFFYRPTESAFQEVLELANAENKETLITGDFNFDFLDASSSNSTKDMKRILSSFNLKQQIDKATRITKESSTLLDLFATYSPKNVTLAKVIPSTLSDHDMLVVVRKINAGKLPPRSVECRNFSNYDHMTFIEELKKCSWDDVYSERDVNSAWSKWKELFLSVCNKHAPIGHKVLRGIICPWLTSANKSS